MCFIGFLQFLNLFLSYFRSGALGDDKEEKADDAPEGEEDPEIAEARREAEERRKEKHRKMEEEREEMRQSIRDKVRSFSGFAFALFWLLGSWTYMYTYTTVYMHLAEYYPSSYEGRVVISYS